MGNPKVSVITSTYNRAETFLPKAIRSVLRQDFVDFEYIIVDDCSTDNTKEVVSGFKDPRIIYHRLTSNYGSDPRPKNEGLNMARGKYIACLDDDCAYRLGALRKLVEELDKNEADVVYGDMWLVPGKGIDFHPQMGIARDFDAQFLLMRNYIDTSVAMFKKEWGMRVGGWDERLPKFIDWNLWVRLMKAGAKFKRIPYMVLDYTVHKETKSAKVKTKTWQHPEFGTMYVPTFDTAGCYWWTPYQLTQKPMPRVAIFTLTYDRLEYTRRMLDTLTATAGYAFDWFVVDNGSTDGTVEWLKKLYWPTMFFAKKNMGITKGSNKALDMIFANGDYDIIGKVDNDCEFHTKNWLLDLVDLWRRNTMLYMSPYPEGLVANPGGGPRVGYSEIGPYLIEVAEHIGGLCAFVDARAYQNFRWSDKFLHGNQDAEATLEFKKQGYMPCYIPKHRVMHDTWTQQKELKPYFERRKIEKTTQA